MISDPQPAVLNPLPPDVHCARDYETLARSHIAGPSYEYIAGGSGEAVTVADNLAAFARRSICPRLLRDVTGGTTRLELAGCSWPHPILLAPVAFQTLAHPRGELASAGGAAAMETCLVASTLSSYSLEQIAAASERQKWFQLYFQPRRENTLDLVRRARVAGYAAIVATLDAAIQVPGFSALRARFRMPADCVAANLRDHPGSARSEAAAGQSRIFQELMRTAPTWDDLAWLQRQTELPIWVKGVLHPGDAVRLRDLGIAGLVVSNHGGRTLDPAPASLTALPAIRDAVGPGVPLLLDSGIRSGADVFKALAMGADAVMVGRLQVYALAVAGELGVAHMLRLLREELEVCMAMTGCASLADIRAAGLALVPERDGTRC